MSLRINFTPNRDTLYIMLPGVSQAPNTGVLKSIENRLATSQKNYLVVTFPFQDKGFDGPESPTHEVELNEVIRGLEKVSEGEKFKRIVLVGKSFGALIAIKLIATLQDLFNCPIELHILGFIFDDGTQLDKKSVSNVFVYQGELDRFGSPVDVEQKMPFAKVFTIVGADHSYRNENKEPVYESDVEKLFFSVVTL